MTRQLSLELDRDNAAEKSAAIDQVEANNSPTPFDLALTDLQNRLESMQPGATGTSDSLVPDLERYGYTDNRAVGAVMRHAARSGWIKATGQYRPSERPGNHHAPRMIYANTIHQH